MRTPLRSEVGGKGAAPQPGNRFVSCVRARGGGEVWFGMLLNPGRHAETLCFAGVLKEDLEFTMSDAGVLKVAL